MGVCSAITFSACSSDIQPSRPLYEIFPQPLRIAVTLTTTPLGSVPITSPSMIDFLTLREDADYIMEASQTLLEIVGNILDINKIEANKMEITDVKYNFKEEVERLARIDATRIGEKNINFKISYFSIYI